MQVAMLLFNVAGLVVLYALQRLQGFLPAQSQGFGAVAPDLAFNTAASFVTNTNWQAYGGESTLSYLTQMLGLTVQNFVSAATGHGHSGRAHSWPHAPDCRDHRQFLGRSDPQHPLYLTAALSRSRIGSGLARYGPDLRVLSPTTLPSP